MRISSVDVRGYKGIERLYELGPATVLLGPNGSGKSTCLESLRYALLGVVPAGKALDVVAEYFPPRGGSVTVHAEGDTRWISRGIVRDLEKAKVSEKFEYDGPPGVNPWVADPAVLDFKEFLTLSPAKRREYILRLVGSGERDAPVLRSTAAEYAKMVGGPGAKPDILDRDIGDLPAELQPLARAWSEKRGLSEVIASHYVAGRSTSETCLALLEVAREQMLAHRGRARDARAAIRELESEAQGARAAAAELQQGKMRVEDLQARLQIAAGEEARWKEARERLEACMGRADGFRRSLAQAKEILEKTPDPGPAPEPPAADPRRAYKLAQIMALEPRLQAAFKRKVALLDQRGLKASCVQRAIGLSKDLERELASPLGKVLTLMELVPDAADPGVPPLRAAVEAMGQSQRKLEASIREQLDATRLQLGGLPADLEESYLVAEKEIQDLDAEKKTRHDELWEIEQDSSAAEKYEREIAAHKKATVNRQRALDAVSRAEAALAAAVEEARASEARLAQVKAPDPSPAALEPELYRAKDTLAKAEKASGAVRAYEEAIRSAEASEILEEAWKRCGAALRVVQEALVGKATAPLLEVANEVFRKAGRPERLYLELENDRGKPIFELGWIADGVKVSLPALSGGQAMLVSAALSVAIALRSPGLKILLIEADPLDEENLQALFPALLPWAEKLDALIVATKEKIEDPEGWRVIRLEGKEVAAR